LLARLQKYPSASDQKAEEAKPEEIDRLVAQAKTPDEIANVIRQLRAMQARIRPPMYSNSEPVNATLNTLVSIERTYREFQAGLPTKFELTSPQPGDATSPSVTPLKVQLLMLVLPRYLNLPSDLTAKSGETVNQFLERIMEEARRRGDPGLLGRTRDVQRSLMTGTCYMDTTTGTNAFVAGQNQEKAGQFMLAVMSYQNALRSGGDAMPVKLIGQRLSALKAEHPQEYEEGMTHFLAPAPRPWEQPTPSPMPRNGPSAVISVPVPGRVGSVAPTPTPAASPMPSASPASP
jgi:hypothetical protein